MTSLMTSVPMNASSPEPRDHHHAMSHPTDVSGKGHEQHGTTGHADVRL